VGLINRFLPLLLLVSGSLAASPKLRLSASTVGPLSIAQGGNGSSQTVEAYNIGDSSLNLSLTSSVTWIGTSVGAQRACSSRAGICTPLSIALNTSGLPAGITTGIVTVSDPNAVDAPQTITVTVQIGGGVPNSVDVYSAPGSSNEATFSSNSPLNLNARTSDGGSWLTVALDGVGSFRFSYPYRLRVSPAVSMQPGTYTGTVTTAGSAFAADNKNIAVTMRVTTQPIAAASTDRVKVKLAQGAPRLLQIGVGTYGAIVNEDGSIPMPLGSFPGVNTHPAHTGDTLTIYAIGLGATSPQPASGEAAPATEPLARLTSTPSVKFGGNIAAPMATPLFAGLTPTYAGLYQLNVTIPSNAPKGTVDLILVFGDSVSNAVQIVIQ
jgi:uncharacterized protein (TIGR03437 family)